MDSALALADYRRRVAASYATVRSSEPGLAAWRRWVAERDALFRSHSQSALPREEQDDFSGLSYFDYQPAWRMTARVEPLAEPSQEVSHSGVGMTRFRPIGTVSLPAFSGGEFLRLYWLEGYGGGLFLPFRDGTAGAETYGGGRYLLDTVKGADLGVDNDGELVLDFNYAYHPSCVYGDQWSCPLAPPENQISARVTAGERLGTD